VRGEFAALERLNGEGEIEVSPVELPDEPLSEEPLSLPEELLSVPEEPLAEVSPDAEPDASPDVEAPLSPVALPLVSAEPLLSAEPLPEEVALPPWVLLTMKAAPSSVSPLLLSRGVSEDFCAREEQSQRT
jgi:hypothetical protein